jgi:tetratricopeptide (TPR) repeat protein
MADPTRAKRLLVTDLLDRGLVQYALGAREGAIDLWQQALVQAPRNARALDYLESVGALPAGSSPSLVAVDPSPATPDGGLVVLEPKPSASLAPPFTQEVVAYDGPPLDSDELDLESMVPDVILLLRDAVADWEAGRFEAALGRAEDALRREPENEEAERIVSDLKGRLVDKYLKELDPRERVPYLRATDASILELSLDPIGGFLISQIDGEITIEELLTILGTFDEYRVLHSLHFFLENGIIELR